MTHLAQMLAALPSKQSTRISVARMIGEFMVSEGAADSFVEYRNLCELGGFDASGPISVADIIARVGGRGLTRERIRLRAARPSMGSVRAPGGGA